MLSQELYTPQWRDQNETTRYPFLATATLTARDGTVLLEGIVVDAALYPVGGGAGLFLAAVTVTRDQAICYVGTEADPALCSGAVRFAAVSDQITLTDRFGRAAGVLISQDGQLATLQGWGLGTRRFTRAATEFAASVCMPTPELGVRAFGLEDGTILAGDVWLVAGAGVVLTAGTDQVPAGTGVAEVTTIRLDVVGDPLFRRRLCGGGDFSPGRFITAVRFVGPDGAAVTVTPDGAGDIALTVTSADADDTVLRVVTTAEGIALETVGAVLGG